MQAALPNGRRTSGGLRQSKPDPLWPIWTAVHAASHLCLSLACGSGPNPDDPKFEQLARELRQRVDSNDVEVKALAADVASTASGTSGCWTGWDSWA